MPENSKNYEFIKNINLDIMNEKFMEVFVAIMPGKVFRSKVE